MKIKIISNSKNRNVPTEITMEDNFVPVEVPFPENDYSIPGSGGSGRIFTQKNLKIKQEEPLQETQGQLYGRIVVLLGIHGQEGAVSFNSNRNPKEICNQAYEYGESVTAMAKAMRKLSVSCKLYQPNSDAKNKNHDSRSIEDEEEKREDDKQHWQRIVQ